MWKSHNSFEFVPEPNLTEDEILRGRDWCRRSGGWRVLVDLPTLFVAQNIKLGNLWIAWKED